MEKYAEKRDELVITARGDPSSPETLQNVRDSIETDYPDTTVRLKRIDEVNEV